MLAWIAIWVVADLQVWTTSLAIHKMFKSATGVPDRNCEPAMFKHWFLGIVMLFSVWLGATVWIDLPADTTTRRYTAVSMVCSGLFMLALSGSLLLRQFVAVLRREEGTHKARGDQNARAGGHGDAMKRAEEDDEPQQDLLRLASLREVVTETDLSEIENSTSVAAAAADLDNRIQTVRESKLVENDHENDTVVQSAETAFPAHGWGIERNKQFDEVDGIIVYWEYDELLETFDATFGRQQSSQSYCADDPKFDRMASYDSFPDSPEPIERAISVPGSPAQPVHPPNPEMEHAGPVQPVHPPDAEVERVGPLTRTWRFLTGENLSEGRYGVRIVGRRLFILIGTILLIYLTIYDTVSYFEETVWDKFDLLLKSKLGVEKEWPRDHDTILNGAIYAYDHSKQASLRLRAAGCLCAIVSLLIDCRWESHTGLQWSRCFLYMLAAFGLAALLVPVMPDYVVLSGVPDIIPSCGEEFTRTVQAVSGTALAFALVLFVMANIAVSSGWGGGG